jgi:2'-5' RNA ligase
MPRLFVAIDLPDRVKDGILAITGRDIAGARWVPRDQLHLTLRFIGEVDGGTFSEIRKNLGNVAGYPFSLQIRGVGHFPPGRNPRVLWVGIDGCNGLATIQSQVEREVVAAGIEPERRRFSPHITIARLRDASTGGVENLEKSQSGFSTEPFSVEEFHLYSSVLGREGAVHKKEATYSLKNSIFSA